MFSAYGSSVSMWMTLLLGVAATLGYVLGRRQVRRPVTSQSDGRGEILRALAVAKDLESIAERLRQHVEQLRIPLSLSEEGHVAVSLSIGLATAPKHGMSFETLFAAADRALYQAKAAGKNCVRVHPSGTPGLAVPPEGNPKEHA